MHKTGLTALLAFALIEVFLSPMARPQDQLQSKREIIPGSELMTHGERERYRARMRGARNSAEAEQIRAEHRKRMEERARQRGLRLANPLPERPSQ